MKSNYKKPTLQDVAQKAGVSIMAASAALNGPRLGVRISESTRERILECASALGYHPNILARSLRQRRTNQIGLYSGHHYLDAGNGFLSSIIGGMMEGCRLHSMDLTLYATFRGSSSDDILDRLIDGRIDGLALFSPEDDPLAEQLRQNPLPVIAIADAQSHLPSVVADDVQGGVLQAEYLSSRNCKHILYHAPAKMTMSVSRRHSAFCERSQELGMEVLDVLTPEIDNPHLTPVAERLLCGSLSMRPDAIVAWEDGHADSIVEQCLAMGLQVPQDVMVVGFNGLKTACKPAHCLTTVHAPWDTVGMEAVHLLVSQINGETVPLETILPVELIQGDTA